ncbi:U-box domain-containing protein 10 isoform X1 [Elaeis guineensis]|uniref:RING-type E3 ubiquitin transferase n=1 Tax=Elaeis guineensis var. tenera TaxID=51953 RepID=A0A6I9QWD0_ELAGV|nr:U-box domain-containing protein 11 isoform X1 [Elaeis guineensis]XP_019704435.1 U-box domain-containing protein 11 isoform X1 [Elaeis guineensis]
MASAPELGASADALLTVVRRVSIAGGFAEAGPLRADCLRLARKVSLLVHLLEEIRDSAAAANPTPPSSPVASSSSRTSPSSFLADLTAALEAVERFLILACRPPSADAPNDMINKHMAVQCQYATWQLEKTLGNLPSDYFDISDEVQEQVELVRAQLRRAAEKDKSNLQIFSEIYDILFHVRCEEVMLQSSSCHKALKNDNPGHADIDFQKIIVLVAEVNGRSEPEAKEIESILLGRLQKAGLGDPDKTVGDDMKSSNDAQKTFDEIKKPDSPEIPRDFRCPISLELMRDPVIVATGQTYERSSIQRWIDCGNRSCPKTQQKLQHLTLTPNYVLRSLIMQWCEENGIQRPHGLTSGRIRKSNGSYHEICGDTAKIEALVHSLSSSSMEEQRSAAAEIRSLAKRSTDNRILIAEAGAIPVLVTLLSADDPKIQEHAVTSILNLSIYDNNKGIIMLAGAIPPMIKILNSGNMEARENAAAAIFSLSLVDENKITIGGTPGAVESLVKLLQNGSPRGKKDAATALFNLCIYHGNKVRAVWAGILTPLLDMLKDPSSNCMTDEALTILSVLVSHQEGKVAVVKANMIPLLIDLLRTSQPRNKENSAAILLALCKKNHENLECIARLGALIPLTELARSGTDRAKRKATSLLEHLNKLQTH